MPVPGYSDDDIQRMVVASEGNLDRRQVAILLVLPPHDRIERKELKKRVGIVGDYSQTWLKSLNKLDRAGLIQIDRRQRPFRHAITDAGRERIERLARKANVQLPIQSSTTPQASDVDEPPKRVKATTYRILRDTKLAREIKAKHNHECQICGHTIKLPDGSRYAEAHHIQPLGKPHDGLDVPGNILCLCPNHHAECDLRAIKLSLTSFRHVDGHDIEPRFIDYHNDEIVGG